MKQRNLVRRLALGFLIIALLPMAGLAWFYQVKFEHVLTATVLQTVSSIADKKSDQIDSFINERLADGRAFAGQAQVREALMRGRADPQPGQPDASPDWRARPRRAGVIDRADGLP